MCLIYRDFFCSDIVRDKLIENDKQKLAEENEKISDVFSNRKFNEKKDEDKREENKLVVVEKEKWYIRLFSVFKKLFGRKH